MFIIFFVEGFFLSALQSYDGFSPGGKNYVFFFNYPCDRCMEMRQMKKKDMKSGAKVVRSTLFTGARRTLSLGWAVIGLVLALPSFKPLAY